MPTIKVATYSTPLRHPPGANQLNLRRLEAFPVEDGARAPVEMILIIDSTLTGDEEETFM